MSCLIHPQDRYREKLHEENSTWLSFSSRTTLYTAVQADHRYQGCDWDCLRHIIGNLTPNWQLRERDRLLVACHEHSIGKSSSLNTILPFLRVAGDPLWSPVTVLGICKILEYKTWKNHPEPNTKLASHYTLQQHELSKESLLIIFITAWLVTVDHYHLLGKPIFNINGFTFSIRITL